MIKHILILFLFVAGVTNTAIAKDALLEQVQAKYKALSSFSVSCTQELYNADAKETEKRSGTFIFMKPMLLEWKTIEPVEERIIVTTKDIWNYIPEDSVAFRYPLSMLDDIGIFVHVLTGQVAIEQSFTRKTLQKSNGTTTFVLIPKKENPSIVTLELTVSNTTYEIIKVVITDYYHNTNTITLNNFTANPAIDKNIFEFTPPEGTNIIDNSYDSPIPE